jgi:transcriptional regulator with XRE-family HTH domain
MSRPKAKPVTALGEAVQRKRGSAALRDIPGFEISDSTLSRIERGKSTPSVETARALATWLGWSLEQVFEAAEREAG